MEIPSWEEYESLKDQIGEYEQNFRLLIEALGIAQYRVNREVFKTREEAETAKTLADRADTENLFIDGVASCSGVPAPNKIVVELPEL